MKGFKPDTQITRLDELLLKFESEERLFWEAMGKLEDLEQLQSLCLGVCAGCRESCDFRLVPVEGTEK